jgi:hypothetical protein
MKIPQTFLLAFNVIAVLISHTVEAQTKASPKMSFFISSVGKNGGSGNLGGLQGADAHCQSLAEQVGAGERRWRAYLSSAPSSTNPRVNARDRIGTGPWYNAKGVLIAHDLDELHSDRNQIDRYSALTENGDPVTGRMHDILTGSDAHGNLASVYGMPATCENWTSDDDGHAMMGHHDRFMDRGARFSRWNRSWVAAHPSRGCDTTRIKQTGSAGLFYCFASNDERAAGSQPALATQSSPASFKRGLNIAHWLSHNYLPAAPYGASWFDEEDVAWIAAQGFDHLRLRIAGDRLIDKNGDINASNITHIDHVLAWAKKHKLGVVLTMFSLPGFRQGVIGEPAPVDKSSPFTDLETRYDAEYVWWQLARRYSNEGAYLRFELLHRPSAPDAASMQTFNETMLKAIRTSNPTRVVYVTSHKMDMETLSEVMNSDLISSDWNIALAFEDHNMDVFSAQFDEKRPLVKFPGTVPDMSAVVAENDPIRKDFGRQLTTAEIDGRFTKFAEAARRFAWGREIYLAEFCVFQRADDRSAMNYIRTVKNAAEGNGFSWSVYDYQSGCAIRTDDGTGKPTRILQALELRK